MLPVCTFWQFSASPCLPAHRIRGKFPVFIHTPRGHGSPPNLARKPPPQRAIHEPLAYQSLPIRIAECPCFIAGRHVLEHLPGPRPQHGTPQAARSECPPDRLFARSKRSSRPPLGRSAGRLPNALRATARKEKKSELR